MRKMIALRIVADKLRFHVDTRQTVLIDGQQRDLFFGQVVEQGGRLERVARLFHRFGKYGAFLGGQMQDADHRVQHVGGIARAFAGQGHVETGLVIGEQHAIAVINKAAFGRDRQHMHAVVFGDGGVVVELGDLQEIQPAHQRATDRQHQCSARDKSFIDQPFLGVVIFERDRLGHGGGASHQKTEMQPSAQGAAGGEKSAHTLPARGVLIRFAT